ncbi:MAG: hypothetical protein KatS3mg082_0100 [Nitrospiraceae bacterium]|nr:MAG: hypothetical protein KatS3mg082_0100 [Nitrospiraceae bacterium]
MTVKKPLRMWSREAFSLLQQLFQMTVTDSREC